MVSKERARLSADPDAWKRWGPYLSERAWGTVREDYSANGDAWNYFSHDQARSRAYRWSEDGLAGISDDRQRLCFAFAFWNGNDDILKERIFGLSGPQGNHGEDAKEYWWYLDSTPTHSYMSWRYLYPHDAFPYERLVEENARRDRSQPEFELVDTGIFDDDRYFDIGVEYAKADTDDICVRVTITNAAAQAASIHVLPTLWYRNRWAWGQGFEVPSITLKDGALVASSTELGERVLSADGDYEALFCDNDTNSSRLWGSAGPSYPKDGINDHVVNGSPTVNPDNTGTKAALWYRLDLAPGETREIRLRLSTERKGIGQGFEKMFSTRQAEADEFYVEIETVPLSAEERMIVRQASAGMLWCKEYYHYNVERWLAGDPPTVPPTERWNGRNAGWRHLDASDIISMPDKWEYPWFAAWDLGFHCVSLAHLDPEFAKSQLLLMCREWYMHPNGELPAYEWSFSDVNPPVHAWATKRVFELDGSTDYEFLQKMFTKLALNFTWWVNRKDSAGDNVFEGGFLGLDNIGPIDRSKVDLPGLRLEESDGTSWMAQFCLNMWEIALVLAMHDPSWEDMAVKFFEHFTYIASAMYDKQLWDETDGFFYDVMQPANGGQPIPLRVRSLVGLLPLIATMTLSKDTLARLPLFAERLNWFLEHKHEFADRVSHRRFDVDDGNLLFAIVDQDRLLRVLQIMLDESEFLSPHGLRSLSATHREHPFVLNIEGLEATVDYEPGESTTSMFGGNSNWRGPVWFPPNYLLIRALRKFDRFYEASCTLEMPSGSGHHVSLADVADELSRRLVTLFRDDQDKRRPVFGDIEFFQRPGPLHDRLFFHEYFHGDNGKGLGASHQTGWTGLVANLLLAARS